MPPDGPKETWWGSKISTEACKCRGRQRARPLRISRSPGPPQRHDLLGGMSVSQPAQLITSELMHRPSISAMQPPTDAPVAMACASSWWRVLWRRRMDATLSTAQRTSPSAFFWLNCRGRGRPTPTGRAVASEGQSRCRGRGAVQGPRCGR